MKKILKRIIAITFLTFVIAVSLIAYPFAAIYYIITGRDSTIFVEDYFNKDKG